jgi:enamine deaminase RidA (YjgF/YER057c/UK114 family)
MAIERLNPSTLAKPSGFSHAVVAQAGQRIVFLAGQTALDSDGRIVGSTVVEQFEQALSNVLIALGATGGVAQHLASLTIYVVDVDDYRENAREIGSVWRRLVGREYPAMAAIGVSRLWDEDAKVEIQGVALIPSVAGRAP